MESPIYKKEEEIDHSRPYKLIKKEEEDLSPKVEETHFPRMAYWMPVNPYYPQMMMPWWMSPFPMRPNFMYYNHPAQQANYFPRRSPVRKPFKIIREAKNSRDIKKVKAVKNVKVAKPQEVRDIKIESKVEEDAPAPSFIIQKKEEFEPEPEQVVYPIAKVPERKKAFRVSACKNYIGLVCAGFARTLLNAGKDSLVYSHLLKAIEQKKEKYTLKDESIENLVEMIKAFIHKRMCGKKIKRFHGERDFKVRNTYELESLLTIKVKDSESTHFKKEVLIEMLNYFFESDSYVEWVSTGMINESNKLFFLKNQREIHKKFLNPAFEKPKFNHIHFDL